MTMTARQVKADFSRYVKPAIVEQFGKKDKCAMRTAFNDFTDGLHKSGEITERTYNTICL